LEILLSAASGWRESVARLAQSKAFALLVTKPLAVDLPEPQVEEAQAQPEQ